MIRKVIISFVCISVLVIAGIGYRYYGYAYDPNVQLEGKKTTFFYIPTGASIQTVTDSLHANNYLIDRIGFKWLAEKKNYANHIHPGKYLLNADMNNNELIDLLRSGNAESVTVEFNNLRTVEQVSEVVSNELEFTNQELLGLIHDEKYLREQYGMDLLSIATLFIPNTYYFRWNTSAEEFLKRMAKEYKAFWTEDRKKKIRLLGLSQTETVALASIVEKETAKSDEKPKVAGVYYNRIQKGMPLQADPTLIFALKDFTIHRVLNKHKKIDSPYNTYMYAGLPPGPICIPEISSMDAVINLTKHKFFYFCAKDDFSGYHNFATTYAGHLVNAKKWHNALNKKKVFK